jgi:2,4-dienoyl-CoA reductase-like NADH-dependent reductase (Old Yellow Enzyme family)/thioredoxin reductase
MELKNRIAFAPLLMVGDGDGSYVGDKIIRWHEARARGGTGLIMMGAVIVSTAFKDKGVIPGRVEIGLYDDKFIPGFSRLAKVVHSYGAKIGVQLACVGPMNGIGPSLPPYPDEAHRTLGTGQALTGMAVPVHELSIEEIALMEDDFAAAAARAKAAGLDCAELHCAHGGATLHCSFISPYYNKRTDQYGGNWENRLRFPVETIKKMRQAVGNDFPIFVRINADDFLGTRGTTVETATKHVVPALEAAGVDCIDVSQGCIVRVPFGITIPLFYPRGCFIHYAAAVKQVTKLPVIGVGRIVDLDMAERFVEEGKADIINLGRAITADPDAPKKYYEGNTEDIRRCIGCLDNCVDCAINYDIHQNIIPLMPAKQAKKVLVIGGGVGGMEAARIATLRGHKVTLMERDSELGGIVAALARVPLTAEFRNILDYLSIQLRRLRVDVRLCREATLADIEEMKPDVVIVAAGSTMLIPEVAQGQPGVMTYVEAAKRPQEIGQRVVIWGLVAAEMAVSLAEQGKDVVMIGRGGEDTLARDSTGARRPWLLRKLTDLNVVRETPEAVRVSNPEVLYYVDVEKVTPAGIKIVNQQGERRVLPYDTFIIARERVANDSLYNQLQGKVAEIYKIGDCSEVGTIKKAIVGANEVARRI